MFENLKQKIYRTFKLQPLHGKHTDSDKGRHYMQNKSSHKCPREKSGKARPVNNTWDCSPFKEVTKLPSPPHEHGRHISK
jgi:hypothetical protein